MAQTWFITGSSVGLGYSIVEAAPLAEPLSHGMVFIQYRAENLRIVPVFGPKALDVSPRIGHIHVIVDDAPWHWADTSGEPLILVGLPAGPHKVQIILADANHQPLDVTPMLAAAGSRRDRMATTLRSRNARHHPDDERCGATGSRRRSLEIDLPRRRLPEYDIVRS